MSLSAELVALVQNEIPEGRQSLTDSHTNLEKVAAYCIENFSRAENKQAALEETKNYTTQSLASVAYQINTLAFNFLQMMDQQAHQLADMESQVNYIAEMVMIHKEKVARREIGVLTTNKSIMRQFKILAPASTEKPIKYIRKAIDFNKLDDIGHGVRVSSTSNTPRSRRSNASSASQPPLQQLPSNASSVASSGAVIYGPPSAGPPPTTKPPTPPQSSRAVTSLARGSREYRTPPVVAPPQVPINYAPNYPIGHPRRAESAQPLPQQQQRGYGALSHPGGQPPLPPSPAPPPPPPQVGMVHPMTQQLHSGAYGPGVLPQEQPYGPHHQSVTMPRYPTVIRPAMTLPKNVATSSGSTVTESSGEQAAPQSPVVPGNATNTLVQRQSSADNSSPPSNATQQQQASRCQTLAHPNSQRAAAAQSTPGQFNTTSRMHTKLTSPTVIPVTNATSTPFSSSSASQQLQQKLQHQQKLIEQHERQQQQEQQQRLLHEQQEQQRLQQVQQMEQQRLQELQQQKQHQHQVQQQQQSQSQYQHPRPLQPPHGNTNPFTQLEPAPPSPTSSGLNSELDFSTHRSSGASSPPLPPPPPHEGDTVDLVPQSYIEKVIAVYDYTADKDDELTFSENAVIYVLKKNDDGWWEGVLNGITGLFPGNYVEPLM